ncbi:MAG: hypothetical protein IT320_12525 [Anaerolineae bacterium]|nr:hypothetical protein [Anaerolineae bacterium]
MADQTQLSKLLENLMQKLVSFQQVLRVALRDKDHPQSPTAEKEGALEVHSGPPLDIGNELLITDEIVKVYHDLKNARGRVVIIDQVSAQEHDAIKASAFGIQVCVDMKVAQQMREAYLRREQV